MKHFFKENKGGLKLFAFCAGLYLVTFALYHLPLGAVVYPTVLCLLVILIYAGLLAARQREKHKTMSRLKTLPDNLLEELAVYDTVGDREYIALIEALQTQNKESQAAAQREKEDSMDYYTAWVHQIKTPIAAMRLRLEGEDSSLSRAVKEELFRVEQYVEMVLTYQRLNANSTDYVFKTCQLEPIVKGTLRRLAGPFIGRGLHLQLDLPPCTLVTDEKWLAFVLEQILSNALKYTSAGGVRIFVQQPKTLCIEDTGMGIAPEDLPRIFEKGYTGHNGRVDKRASGLGLYLCKRICDNLGVGISAKSTLGTGTTILLNLDQNEANPE